MEHVEGDELDFKFFKSFDALPRCTNDEDYSRVSDITVKDEDVLMLCEDGNNGYSDAGSASDSDKSSVDNSALGPGSLASFVLSSVVSRIQGRELQGSFTQCGGMR